MPTTTRRAPGGLAAELAALANPAPTPMRTELPDDDFDPSGGAVDPADDSSDGFSGDEDSDGGGDDGDRDDGVLRPTRADRDAGTGGKLRMRAGIALDDEEYVGKSSSRRAMERAWAGEEEDEDDDEDDDDLDDVDEEALMQDESEDDEEDEEEEEDDEDDDEEDEEEDEDDDSDGNDAAMLGDGYGINGEDEQMDDDDSDADAYADDSDADPDDSDQNDAGGGSGDDPDLEAELAAFREEEAEANRLAAARSQNAVKGAAVRRQNDAWERSLRARILLQRGVNAAAKLPTPAYMDALKASDEGVAPAAATAAGAARGALSALLRLQAALMDGNPAIAAAAEEDADVAAADADGKKRKTRSATAEVSRMHLMASPASEVWKAADSMYARYAAFRDRSCDRWHRKAQVSVGKMAGGGGPGGRGGGGGEMRAFNQSLSAQVQSAMRLPERLVSRSQPPSHLAPRRLGEPAAAAEEDATAPAEDGDEDGALAAAAAAKEGERRVAELYDDADFYEQVLKEFLESAGGGVAGAAAATKPPKRRKVVDRRASKGRKLRYHIQQPLVNFCAPVELEVPAWAEKVFGQLFASKA